MVMLLLTLIAIVKTGACKIGSFFKVPTVQLSVRSRLSVLGQCVKEVHL